MVVADLRTVVLRRVLAQPTECPRIAASELVVDAPHRVPGRLIRNRRKVQFGARGIRAGHVPREHDALNGSEEEEFVSKNRSAERATPFIFSCRWLSQIVLSGEEIPRN